MECTVVPQQQPSETLHQVLERLGWSREGLVQLMRKSRKEWIAMLRRDPAWTEVKSLRGHPRFVNPHLSWPHSVINIHFDPHRTEPKHLLKQHLAALGWTEEYARKMGFIH